MAMKAITKVFAPLVGVLIGVASCHKEPIESIPEIRLSKDEISAPAEGGTFNVTYSIINPASDMQLLAEPDQDWLQVDCSVDNVIKITVAQNAADTLREAHVSVSYGQDAASASIDVTQQGVIYEPDPFEIKVRNIEMEAAVVDIIPEDPDMEYAPISVTEDIFEQISNGDLYDGVVSYLWSLATDYGLPLDNFLKTYVLTKGDSTYPMKGLYPGNTYYILAVGMNAAAEQLSPVVCADFSTEPVEMNGATFEISYQIGRPNVIMSVKPSSNSIYYYYDALRKKDVENMEISLEESLKSYFDECIAWGNSLGLSREEVMAEMLSQGESSFEYTTLYASTEYIGMAVSATLQGYINSEITQSEFMTDQVVMSDNQLSLELSNIGVDKVDMKIDATNDDPYCMVVMETSTWPELTPEEYMNKLVNEYSLESRVNTGSTAGTMKGLSSETEYIVLLFGYANGKATTELVYEIFTTRPEGNPEELTFVTEFSDVACNSLTVSIVPTPDNAMYTSTLVDASFTEDDVYEYIEQTANMYIEVGMVASLEEFLMKISVRGAQTTVFEKLFSETEYKMFAIGVYPETGKYATAVYMSQSVRTHERVVSDVAITLDADKYFDGAEVADLYPEHASAAGRAIIPVHAVTTGAVEKYYYQMFLDDLTDPSTAPDDALIMELTAPLGGISKPDALFYCEYDRPYTLVAVAKDSDGNFGNVFRELVVCTEGGCSPADEFTPVKATNSQMKRYIRAINCGFNGTERIGKADMWHFAVPVANAKVVSDPDERPQLWIKRFETEATAYHSK